MMFHPSGTICAQNVRFYTEATLSMHGKIILPVCCFPPFPQLFAFPYIYFRLTCSFLLVFFFFVSRRVDTAECNAEPPHLTRTTLINGPQEGCYMHVKITRAMNPASLTNNITAQTVDYTDGQGQGQRKKSTETDRRRKTTSKCDEDRGIKREREDGH